MAIAPTVLSRQNEKLDEETLSEILQEASKLSSITKIHLQRTGLSPNLAVQLADFLEVNTTIVELDLTGNPIGSHGAECIATSLRKNKSLERLILSDCSLKSDAVAPWSEFFVQRSNDSKLMHLNLSNNQIDDDSAEALGELIRVAQQPEGMKLDLRNNWLADESMNQIASSMQSNQSVLELRIEGNQDESSVVRRKQISFYTKRNRENHKRQFIFKQIHEIQLSLPLFASFSIECITLSLADATLFSTALINNRTLHTICLRDNALPAEGAKRILAAIEQHPCLVSISMLDNNIGDVGVLAMSRLVRRNPVVRILHVINSMQVIPTPLLPRTLSTFYYAFLSDTTYLHELSLVNCGLTDHEIGVIIPGIGWCCRLQALSVRNNRFGDRVSHIFARMLKRCSAMYKIDVSGNAWSLKGILPIVYTAQSHPTLRSLCFGRVPHYDETSLCEIVNCLSDNRIIAQLDLATKERSHCCVSKLEPLQQQIACRRPEYEKWKKYKDESILCQAQKISLCRTAIRQFAQEQVQTWLNEIPI